MEIGLEDLPYQVLAVPASPPSAFAAVAAGLG